MTKYFQSLAADLRELNWSQLERVARDEFDLDPEDYDDRESLVQACVSQEQYAAFS